MDTLCFIIRYIPFWAIPLIIISGEFAYIYKLKLLNKMSYSCMFIAFIALVSVVFYYWAGGPKLAVIYFLEMTGNS